MVLKLYTSTKSTGGRRIALMLQEKQIPYELVQPNFAIKEHKSEEWKKHQPFGQMPYIDDDGFVLFESRAVARYIATQYASVGTPLLPCDPSDAKAMALLDQAISVEVSNFDTPVVGLAMEKWIYPMMGGTTNLEAVAKYESILNDRMEGFERILSKQKYMAGDSLTFVDLFYCPCGKYIEEMGLDHFTNESKYPNVARWWKVISTRKSWLAVKDGIPPSLM